MTDLTGSLPCLCPDNTCDRLGCVAPVTDWWKSATTKCDLVVDPEWHIHLAGTVYAQARECKNLTASSVIDIDDDWVIDIHITLKAPPYGLCAYWCVSACLESMCEGKWYRFPKESADKPYCCCLVEITREKEYEISICIPHGTVKESECGAPYEPTVIVTLLDHDLIRPDGEKCDPGNHTPLGVATACELPLMTFYDGG